jgi:hypothetical protein
VPSIEILFAVCYGPGQRSGEPFKVLGCCSLVDNWSQNKLRKAPRQSQRFPGISAGERRFMKTNANSTPTALEATDKNFERMIHKFFACRAGMRPEDQKNDFSDVRTLADTAN